MSGKASNLGTVAAVPDLAARTGGTVSLDPTVAQCLVPVLVGSENLQRIWEVFVITNHLNFP